MTGMLRFKQAQRHCAMLRACHLEAIIIEEHFQRRTEILVVFHDQDRPLAACIHQHPSPYGSPADGSGDRFLRAMPGLFT
jgi:hypothetical protein